MGVTDVTEALSLKHNLPNVDIYTNSWGPSEGFEYAGPGSVTENAFYDGVTKVFLTCLWYEHMISLLFIITRWVFF